MSSFELIGFAAATVAAGAATGLIAGLFGVGGGTVMVPVLFALLRAGGAPADVAMHMAAGTSLMTIIPTSLCSWRAHARHGAVDGRILRRWAPSVTIGAALGAAIADRLPGADLQLVFGVFILVVALTMIFVRPRAVSAVERRPAPLIVRRAAPALIGLISAVAGIGGGSLSVPALSFSGVPIHRAVGTAAAVGCLIGVPATVIFLLTPAAASGVPGAVGYVNVLAFALLAPATMLMAPQGAKLAHRLPALKLRRLFAVFLLAVAVKMIAGAGG
ncbi:MAG TPA: sulfite exporter TauE/SafE family protein [Alphaproteobacteria bacterium]|nr:sulfite exporter TauE/SafE family protein [Alphaproteobacteria bacterium]